METVEKKAKPDAAEFYRLVDMMRQEGFHRISPREMRDDRYRYGVRSITYDPGREEGFRYTQNGYTVRVWSSFVEATQTYKEHDYGFVLIVRDKGNFVAYWGRLIRRTKNFTDNIFMLGRKCKQVVQGVRPCPDEGCRHLMHIVPGRAGKGRMYACINDVFHGRGKGPTMSIDSGLTEDMKAYALQQRAARKRDNADSRRKTPRARGFANRKPRHVQTFAPAG